MSKRQPRDITPEMRHKVFEYWVKVDRNVLLTAKHFGHSRTTIHRWAKAENWLARAEKIKENIRAGLDRKIEKDQISNAKLAHACLQKEVTAYLRKEKIATGNLPNIVMLMRYLDEVEGNMPNGGGANGDNIVNIWNNLDESQKQAVRANFAADRF